MNKQKMNEQSIDADYMLPCKEMHLRDYFAAQAMLGMYGDSYNLDIPSRAKWAYEMADAMMEARAWR
jgi:hypothetical protein